MRVKKKTLIIHASDPSTDFLKPIYKGMHNKTVVNGGIDKAELIKLINSHDRIFMMGHGWTSGLFNTPNAEFKTLNGLVIDGSDASLLIDKECVFIWCRAHVFVDYFGLKGFNTDMFISEVGEASWFGMTPTQAEVDLSNETFVKIFKKYHTKDGITMQRRVKKHYSKLAETNEVAEYNAERLFHN